MILLAYFLILFNLIILTNTIEVTPETFQDTLSKAQPGDIIELSSGTYNKAPYKISTNGISGHPIIIKPADEAKIIFQGSNNDVCIFELINNSYIYLEGKMEMINAYCGIKILDSNSINIKGLLFHEIKKEAIIVSGENIEISDNEIYHCSSDSKEKAPNLMFGESQCTSVLEQTNNVYSKYIYFKNNHIYDSYGEGIKLLFCEYCSVTSNIIQNTLALNLYLYNSKNTLIEGNLIEVTKKDYNSKFGKAVGIGLSSDFLNIINNITIQNNLIIGCRIGIYYFPNGIGSYELIKIYHNTIWMMDITPIWFTDSLSNKENNELYNNFLYHNLPTQFSPKSVWKIGYNVYYNTESIPQQYKDTQSETSKAVKALDLSFIFNNQDGACNYKNFDTTLNINCFRPSDFPDKNIKLFQGGTQKSVEKDFEGCIRNKNPSIGAFEYPDGCEEETDTTDTSDTTDTTDIPDTTDEIITDAPETEIPLTDEPEPEKHYDVIFKIHYVPNSGESIKIMGSFCQWEIGQCPFMYNSNNYWTYTFNKGTESTFNYKFAVQKGSSITRWEKDPNRVFNGPTFDEQIKKGVYSDTIESCSYVFNNEIITLTCSWDIK